MTEIADPLAGQTGTTALLLLRLSDDEVRQYVAHWEQKHAARRAAGHGEAGWWASKSVSAGEHELRQRGLDRATGTATQREEGLPRSAALRICRDPRTDATTETWVRDPYWGWVRLDDEDDVGGTSFAELLGGIDDGADIEIAGPGCTRDEVLAALPLPEDADDDQRRVLSIDSVYYGQFSDHGWFPFHEEYDDVPANRPLVDIHIQAGGLASGSSVSLLGEIRPGLLVEYWDCDGMERGHEISVCDVADYVERMRSALAGDTDLEQLAVDRALAEGSGWWDGDELDPEEGSPTASISVSYDETLLPPSG